MQKTNKIHSLASSPLKMKFFMLQQLPMGFLAGLKVTEINGKGATITVPNKFLNKNPFKSMYFAVQAMAAELSSGILALAEVYAAEKPVSMLVFDMRASFQKKARTRIAFKCNDGEKIKMAIAKSIQTGEGQTVDVTSTGVDTNGDVVAEFVFTWTFKPK